MNWNLWQPQTLFQTKTPSKKFPRIADGVEIIPVTREGHRCLGMKTANPYSVEISPFLLDHQIVVLNLHPLKVTAGRQDLRAIQESLALKVIQGLPVRAGQSPVEVAQHRAEVVLPRTEVGRCLAEVARHPVEVARRPAEVLLRLVEVARRRAGVLQRLAEVARRRAGVGRCQVEAVRRHVEAARRRPVEVARHHPSREPGQILSRHLK